MLTSDDLQAIRTIVREVVYDEVPGIVRTVVAPELSAIHSRLAVVDGRLDKLENRMAAMDEDATVVYEMLGRQHTHLKLHDRQLKNAGRNFEVLAEYAGLKLKKPLAKL